MCGRFLRRLDSAKRKPFELKDEFAIRLNRAFTLEIGRCFRYCSIVDFDYLARRELICDDLFSLDNRLLFDSDLLIVTFDPYEHRDAQGDPTCGIEHVALLHIFPFLCCSAPCIPFLTRGKNIDYAVDKERFWPVFGPFQLISSVSHTYTKVNSYAAGVGVYNRTMKDLLTRLSRLRYPYEPLIAVTISRERLLGNLHEFMRVAPAGKVAPVLKSNAYGHGLIEVARVLEAERRRDTETAEAIPFFTIDSYFEAVALRAAGIKTPLLVIGYTRPETIANAGLRDISFAMTSLEALKAIAQTVGKSGTRSAGLFGLPFSLPPLPLLRKREISIHLKIDTGMRRQGILPAEIDAACQAVESNPLLKVAGICTHLSDADNPDETFTETQLRVWNDATKKIRQRFPGIAHVHVANTDGHRFVSGAEATVSRLGLGLYGLIDRDRFSTEVGIDVKPALRMETIVTGTKKLARGESTGYGNTFTATDDMIIATIPVGYYEGLDRRLSNIGSVSVGAEKTPCPIVGRISMNITVVDVTNVPDVSIGTPVTVISDDPDAPNSIVNMARACGGQPIPYELATHIPSHLKRIVK